MKFSSATTSRAILLYYSLIVATSAATYIKSEDLRVLQQDAVSSSPTYFPSTGGTVEGTGAGTTGDASISTTGTGATGTTAMMAQDESWMVCRKDLATSTSLNMGALTFYHYVALAPEGDARGGILCGRLERTDGTEGWMGFGMSPDGEMDDGIGLIGLPDSGTVEKYWLYGKNPFVERMSDDKQTLMFASITQDENGTTAMEFAKFLNEEGELPILANGDNTFLFALGESNELGYHSSGMGSFTLDFKTTESASSVTTTTATTAMTSATSTTFAIESTSTTFAIESTVTVPSSEESTTTSTTPPPMEFAPADKSSAFVVHSMYTIIGWALLLCALI